MRFCIIGGRGRLGSFFKEIFMKDGHQVEVMGRKNYHLLDKIVKRFVSFEKPKKRKKAELYYLKFLELRQNPYNDLKFMISTPFRILRIHVKAINFRKLTKKELSPKTPETKPQIEGQRFFPLRF